MQQIFALIFFCFSLTLGWAQSTHTGGYWRFNTMSFGFGLEQANYGRMSLNEMNDLAVSPNEIQRDLTGLNEDARLSTANGTFASSFGLCRMKAMNNGDFADREIRLGFGVSSPQEAMISFKNELSDTAIVYCSVQQSFGASLGYHFKGILWERLYWSVGFDAGYARTFDNQLIVLSGDYFEDDAHPSTMNELQRDDYAANAVNRTQLMFTHEVGFLLGRHFVLGMNYSLGATMHMVNGADPNFSSYWSPRMNFRFLLN